MAPDKLQILGGRYNLLRVTFRLSCLHNGRVTMWQTSGTGKGNLGSDTFVCTRHRSSVWLNVDAIQRALMVSVGLNLRVDLWSGAAHLSVRVVVRKGPGPRKVQSRAASAFDAYCDGSASHGVQSSTPGRGLITVGPSGWSMLAAKNWGDVVYWRAWLWYSNPTTGQSGWLFDQSLSGDTWNSYRVFANGATQDGAIVYRPDGVYVLVGGTTAPEVYPPTTVFTVTASAGFYFWPVIESWSDGNTYVCSGYAQSGTGAVDYYQPNWFFFP